MIHKDREFLRGVRLATGEVVWKHTQINFGSGTKVLDYFTDVFIIPDGRICIFNLFKLFVLDPKCGAIKYELFNQEGPGCIWSIATSNNGFHERFAIQHGKLKQTQISVCGVLPVFCLPLQNIVD